ncbi:MAG: hypothetical protein Q9163_000120 [Psora crenata]
MADPLTIASSVVGVASLGIQVTQSLVDFYRICKTRGSDLAGITGRLESLVDTFRHLEEVLSGRVFKAEERSLVKRIETSITNCDELVRELQAECQKFSETFPTGFKDAVKVAGRRVTYPFRQSTLQKLDEDISEIRANLSFALGVLQLEDTHKVHDEITEMKAVLELVKNMQISSDLCNWLNAPDATIDHNVACLKKHPGTGSWLVTSSQFSTWLTEGNSIVWLRGFAGSGKSVLCSTAIQSVLRHRGSDRGIGIAFFYFTFNDDSKQDASSMIRALLLQLSSQLKGGHADLTRLHNSYRAGIPPTPVLLEYLRRLIQRFRDVYILLDALDESPRTGPREHVLDALDTMRTWGVQSLHLFVTSRDEPDIRETLALPTTQQVIMQNREIDKDIADFISCRLGEDRRLRKLLPYREKVQDSLAKGAGGGFRWVECQLRSLQSCPRSEDHLDKVLNSLPQSLDETYERMLCNIDIFLIEDARRILTWLSFALRPLEVQELIDAVAVDIEGSPGLNRKRRLQDSNDIRDICLGFVDIVPGVNLTTGVDHEQDSTSTVRIAHFSIQEYLESDRIRHQKAAMFSLHSATAHTQIAQTCLIYLLEHGLSNLSPSRKIVEEFPLAEYAAAYWYKHYQGIVNHAPELDALILRLFECQHAFTTWVELHDVERSWKHFLDLRDEIATPAYYVSLLGLDRILSKLVDKERAGNDTTLAVSPASMFLRDKQINAQGGRYGNALQAASLRGHEKVVQILLEKGSDINAQGGHFGNALQAASAKGHEEVVQILLKKGSNINAQSGHFGNALQAALFGGYEKIVQILLEKGSDINTQGGQYGNALQAASFRGHEKVVKMLLEKGSDINAQGGYFGNALQAASARGHEKVVQILLERGSNINAQGGHFGNALYAATLEGYEKVVQILLEKGSNINAQGGHYGNALQAASFGGHEKVVQILLDKGSDINARGGRYSNALQAALSRGHEKVVQILLEKEAISMLKVDTLGTH